MTNKTRNYFMSVVFILPVFFMSTTFGQDKTTEKQSENTEENTTLTFDTDIKRPGSDPDTLQVIGEIPELFAPIPQDKFAEIPNIQLQPKFKEEEEEEYEEEEKEKK